MTTLLKLIEKQNLAATLLAILTLVVFPTHNNTTQAATNDVLVFEVSAEHLTQSLLTYQTILEHEYLVSGLEDYLVKKQSPLAPFAREIVELPQWEHAMGIVFVESTYCRFARNFNCGSLGVAPGHKQWRKYANAYEGFKDLTTLLEKPMYKDRLNTCKKKLGVYVVPGSSRWLGGCEKVQGEMNELVLNAKKNSENLANQHIDNSQNAFLAFSF